MLFVAISSSSSLELKMERRPIRSWHCVRLVVVVVRSVVYSSERGSRVSRVSREDLEVLKRAEREASDSVSVMVAIDLCLSLGLNCNLLAGVVLL